MLSHLAYHMLFYKEVVTVKTWAFFFSLNLVLLILRIRFDLLEKCDFLCLMTAEVCLIIIFRLSQILLCCTANPQTQICVHELRPDVRSDCNFRLRPN